MEKANMSMLKLLQEELEHNPNPVGIDAFSTHGENNP
jgi:hypothetical protein